MLDRLNLALVVVAFLALASGYAAGPMLALLAVTLAQFATRRLRWPPTSLDRPMLALLVVSLASALASHWRTESLLLVFGFTLTALVSIYPAARAVQARPDALRYIVVAWMVGAVVAAVWGIARVPGTWPIGATTPALGRTAMGTTLAAATALTLGAWTAWNRPWWGRAALALAMTLIVIALVLTTSRAAWIAAVCGVLTLIGLAPRGKMMLLLLCAATLAVAIFASGVSGRHAVLAQRLRAIASLDANADRKAIWLGALRMIRDHPLLGTGYGTFVRAWSLYNDDPALEGKPTAHNVFLNFAAETGVPGLVALLIVLATGFGGLWRRIQSAQGDPHVRALWTAVLAATVATSVQQLFDATILSVHLGYGLLAVFGLATVRDS